MKNKKVKLILDNEKQVTLPPSWDGQCQSCLRKASVFKVSGLDQNAIVSFLCFPCVGSYISKFDIQLKGCKRCRALLFYPPEDTRKYCEECRIEKEYRKIKKLNLLTEAETLLNKVEKIVEEADKNDIN